MVASSFCVSLQTLTNYPRAVLKLWNVWCKSETICLQSKRCSFANELIADKMFTCKQSLFLYCITDFFLSFTTTQRMIGKCIFHANWEWKLQCASNQSNHKGMLGAFCFSLNLARVRSTQQLLFREYTFFSSNWRLSGGHIGLCDWGLIVPGKLALPRMMFGSLNLQIGNL